MTRAARPDSTADQRAELESARDRRPRPHVREKVAAALKFADGRTLRAVGAAGLLRPRDERTVARWVRRRSAGGGRRPLGPAGARAQSHAFFPLRRG